MIHKFQGLLRGAHCCINWACLIVYFSLFRIPQNGHHILQLLKLHLCILQCQTTNIISAMIYWPNLTTSITKLPLQLTSLHSNHHIPLWYTALVANLHDPLPWRKTCHIVRRERVELQNTNIPHPPDFYLDGGARLPCDMLFLSLRGLPLSWPQAPALRIAL